MIELVALGDYHTAVGFLLASPPERSARYYRDALCTLALAHAAAALPDGRTSAPAAAADGAAGADAAAAAQEADEDRGASNAASLLWQVRSSSRDSSAPAVQHPRLAAQQGTSLVSLAWTSRWAARSSIRACSPSRSSASRLLRGHAELCRPHRMDCRHEIARLPGAAWAFWQCRTCGHATGH